MVNKWKLLLMAYTVLNQSTDALIKFCGLPALASLQRKRVRWDIFTLCQYFQMNLFEYSLFKENSPSSLISLNAKLSAMRGNDGFDFNFVNKT